MFRVLTILCLIFAHLSLARDYVAGEEYDKGELVKVEVSEIHPTQFAVGRTEVNFRKKQIRKAFVK